MEEMQRAIREHPIDPGKDTVYYFIQDLFHVLDENRQIASALVGPHGIFGLYISRAAFRGKEPGSHLQLLYRRKQVK